MCDFDGVVGLLCYRRVQLLLRERAFLYVAGRFKFCVAGEFGFGGFFFGNACPVSTGLDKKESMGVLSHAFCILPITVYQAPMPDLP